MTFVKQNVAYMTVQLSLSPLIRCRRVVFDTRLLVKVRKRIVNECDLMSVMSSGGAVNLHVCRVDASAACCIYICGLVPNLVLLQVPYTGRRKIHCKQPYTDTSSVSSYQPLTLNYTHTNDPDPHSCKTNYLTD